jgi:hypothetical protein
MPLSISKTIIIISLLLVSQFAISGQLQDGFVSYKQGDVEASLKEWLALAIKGDVRAQFFLSVLFENLSSSPGDKDNAKRWLTASANNGFVPAQFNMGNNFHKGRYGPVNNKMAEYWWNQAAVQGFPDAQYHLATLYYWGKRGVKLNLKESFYWFEQAAKGGHKGAGEAVLLMRGGEPIPPPETGEPSNIAYDDPRIVSKLSLDARQTALVKQLSKQAAINQKQQVKKIPEAKSVSRQDRLNEEPIATPELSEKVLAEIKVTAPEQPEKEWAEQQPPTNYTLQLLASTSLSECKNHLHLLRKRHQLAFHAQSFTKNGQKYCAVIHGSYESYSQAKAMLGKLPRKLRQGKPWIRKIAR